MANYDQSILMRVAQEEGIDPALLSSVVMAESGGNPMAKSPKGASGLMQLMPATAQELGVTDVFDPEQNLRGGAKYLRQQLERFGDPSLALAAYNAGPANVDKYQGIPPFEETQNYIAKILGGQKMADVTQPTAAPSAAPYDPMANLSKSQRMMLAFGALRDAGTALRGGQGNAFATTMTGINQQQDMVRKMQAEQAQLAQDATNKARIDALLMGGSPTQSIGGGQQIGGVAPIPQVPDVASLDAQINQLRSQGGAYMASGLTAEYSAKLEDLMNQRNELKTTTEASALKSEEFAAKKQKTSSAIKVAQKALSAALGVKPEDVDKVIASGDPLNSSSFWFSRLPLGSMGESQEFKDYANYTKQLSTIMTFENLGEIIKSGVKLGTMTDADFELIGGLSGILDPQSDPEGTATRIADAYTKLTNTLKAMEAEDAGTSSKPNATRPMPKIGDIVDGHRFKGGSVTSQSSWEKI